MSDADQVRELAEFLDHERDDVLEMACEGVAGYTASAEGLAALSSVPDVLVKLLKALARQHPGASTHAAAALVNLSQQPADRALLVREGAVTVVLSNVEDGVADELLTYASMLLANLTQLPVARTQLLAARGGNALRALLQMLCARPGEPTDHLALVLTNCVQEADGRRSLLEALGEGAPSVSKLCAQLWGASELRQQGVAQALRNLFFEANDGAPHQGRLLELTAKLVVFLAARLAPGDD